MIVENRVLRKIFGSEKGAGEERIALWWGNLRVRDVMKNLDVDGRKIF
jgi:hypothetical protein